MKQLLLWAVLGILGSVLHAQNPHGELLKLDCGACHNPNGWEISKKEWEGAKKKNKRISSTTGRVIVEHQLRFDHDTTAFPLTNRHAALDCRQCHGSLVFSEAGSDCISCHTDVHQMTAGADCARCHTTANWLVDNVTELHFENGFPLAGAHATATCTECHGGETGLLFGRIGNDCASCHMADFQATTTPNHMQRGFSMNCTECHSVTQPDWSTDIVQHYFFPLEKGHEIVNCASCHTTGSFSNTPTECFACHSADYQSALQPNHVAADFSTNCATCHTTDLDWMPATFAEHDAEFFPIYSGAHAGEWSDCVVCHKNPSNYAEFTCIECHTNPETDDLHNGVGGYVYENNACLACHPTGDAATPFDHNSTNFPLTGAHLMAECVDCHANGYVGTPTDCAACHTTDFNQSINPNHAALNIPTDCAQCHTTDAWDPADFPIHDQFHPLNGAHASIANDCAACHNGDYNDTPNDCASCHQMDYDQTANPNHVTAQFSTDCASCHTETAWSPSSFDHDIVYPLVGAHAVIANDCAECHINGNYSNTPNTCAGCHDADYQSALQPSHTAAQFSTNCTDCHNESAWTPSSFDHDPIWPLNGAHNAVQNCTDCHIGNTYTTTTSDCFSCHETDFNQTTNPNHLTAQFPTDCASCHSETAWIPSTFNHDAVYPLVGAHAVIANDCAKCHIGGNYTNTPNTCAGCHQTDFDQTNEPSHTAANFSTTCTDCHNETAWMPSSFDHAPIWPLNGAHNAVQNCTDCHIGNAYTTTTGDCMSCHQMDYNQTTNPSHQAAGFNTDCASCHSETAWLPSTFDHDGQHFPIYSGTHQGEWTDCIDCHSNPANYMEFQCINCHTNPQTDIEHQGVGGYVYEDNACLACHPTGDATNTFDHNNTAFPLTGAHLMAVCTDCHIGGVYAGTPTDCVACHNTDFNQSANPNHLSVGIPMNCAQCHTTDAWQPANFPIHDQYYALNGAHASIAMDCATCHNGDYNNTPSDCMGCHSTDFNNTTNPNHVAAQFPTDCATCHSETTWIPSTFDHNALWPLTGEHAAIANDCAQCHIGGNYSNTPSDCVGCHQTDFNQSTNPNHVSLGIPTDCAQCHTADGWQPADFPIHDQYYMLNGAHAVIANDCAQCHIGGNYSNTPNTCAGCHQADYNQTTNPDHTAAQFPTDCASCHSETAWIPSTFDHDAVYPLVGAHAVIANDCAQCHIGGNYTNTPNDCVGCHDADYQSALQPSHTAAQFSTNCTDCHNESAWSPSSFDHDPIWALTGAHAAVPSCTDCHIGNAYTTTLSDCASCHQTDFNQTTNPNHTAAGFNTDCASCHGSAAWTPANFDHDGQYFPIYSGPHQGEWMDCIECHTDPTNYAVFSCTTCHVNPDTDNEHVGVNGYSYNSTSCLACHPTGDASTPFDHNNTAFPLTGAHVMALCTDCHIGGVFAGTPTDCAACHTTDFNQSSNPNHVSLGIPMDCATCHTTDAWNPADFPIHDQYYALTGAHTAVANDCAACHNGDYNNTPSDCVGCHQTDFNQAANPNHVSLNIPTDCAQCHTTDGWNPADFPIHDQYYMLNGAHAAIANDCAQCHIGGNYTNTPNTCAGCHQADFNGTADPNHVNAQFSTTCTDCHDETAWTPSSFDHGSIWPLNGQHAAVSSCVECHINETYTTTTTDCYSCHQTDYNNATMPPHASAGFPTDCASCHTENGWSPATFDHNQYWPLNGAHANVPNCADCHIGGVFAGTPTDCIGCHQADFNGTADPNHVNAQFSTTCTDCHDEMAWTPSTFDHGSIWPLNGQHASVSSCVECHINETYTTTTTDCYSCHQADYNNATMPPHASTGFPTDCASCHTEAGWSPATFDHNQYWPLNGAHANVPNCADCHIGGIFAGTPTDCIGCHQADFNGTADPNHVNAQFSTTCTDCHDETAWTPSSFDHGSIWPLNGQHTSVPSCVQCHINETYIATTADCYSCHQADYNNATMPPHATAGFPTDCASCHTENGWSPATFDHNQYWPLNGAHANVPNCADCHIGGVFAGTPTDCIGCHQADFNGTADPNHVNAQFSTTCTDCHDETAWTPSTFDHGSIWPLNGAHSNVPSCVQCHINETYTTTTADCFSCHLADYQSATNPPHASAGFPTDCASCHTEDAWSPANFNHNQFWPLNGAHANVPNCTDCHIGGVFAGTPTNCNGCHAVDYAQTMNPSHPNAQLSINCTDCHNETAWVPSSFSHTPIWPLNGAHANVPNCTDCHIGENYLGTTSNCISCHQVDYNQTTNPPHASAGFPTNCTQCHTETAWTPATFNHNQFWPLNGAHATANCADCHIGGVYAGTPTLCFACHQTDYATANNPQHQSAGFPTDCTQCHNETAWDPSTFDHDNMYFPIYSGKHDGEWAQCIECHTIPNNFTLFSCIDCHEHDDPVEVARDHQGRIGYQYSSPACYSCHPDGD